MSNLAKVVVGVTVGVGILTGLYIKNRLEENKPKQFLSKQTVIDITKRARNYNIKVLQQLSDSCQLISKQMKISLEHAKQILISSENPINFEQSFNKNYILVCEMSQVQFAQFQASYQHYLNSGDKDIQRIHQAWEKEVQDSLMGKPPVFQISIPEFLTKDKAIEIYKNILYKNYVEQVQYLKKVVNKQSVPNQNLVRNALLKEQQKILAQEPFNLMEGPPEVSYSNALRQYKNDQQFVGKLKKIQEHYSKIFNRYSKKINSKKITIDQLNELEDQLIYNQFS